jgi:hypothetical protein
MTIMASIIRNREKIRIKEIIEKSPIPLDKFDVILIDNRCDINYKGTFFFFRFSMSASSFEKFSYEFRNYNPEYSIYKSNILFKINDVLDVFNDWIQTDLNNYLLDLDIPDPFSIYEDNYGELFGTVDLNEDGHFTSEEIKVVKSSLTKLEANIEQYGLQELKLLPAQIALLTHEIKELNQSVEKLNKKEFRRILRGVVIDVAVSLTLSREQVTKLWGYLMAGFDIIKTTLIG